MDNGCCRFWSASSPGRPSTSRWSVSLVVTTSCQGRQPLNLRYGTEKNVPHSTTILWPKQRICKRSCRAWCRFKKEKPAKDYAMEWRPLCWPRTRQHVRSFLYVEGLADMVDRKTEHEDDRCNEAIMQCVDSSSCNGMWKMTDSHAWDTRETDLIAGKNSSARLQCVDLEESKKRWQIFLSSGACCEKSQKTTKSTSSLSVLAAICPGPSLWKTLSHKAPVQ